jgi:hypothetical protein
MAFWSRPERGRLFIVECECGEDFRVAWDPEEEPYDPDRQLLVPLKGSCPWCGFKLEEIEPFPSEPRSRA